MNDPTPGKILAGGILSLVLFVVVSLLGGWIFAGNALAMFQYFGPKQAEAERKVFEETKAYNDGMTQELGNFRLEYVKGNQEVKKMIASEVRHRYANYDDSKIKDDSLRQWLKEIREVK